MQKSRPGYVNSPKKHIILGGIKYLFCSYNHIKISFSSNLSVPSGTCDEALWSWQTLRNLLWNLFGLNVSTTWSCFSSPLIDVWG